MSQEDTIINPAALELAGLLRPSWPAFDAELRASGVPLCEGDDEDGDGDGDGESDADDQGDDGDGGDGKPETFDREYVEKLRRENAAARKARQEAEQRVKDFEDKDKSEQQKLAERAEAAEKRAQEAESKALRLKVGQSKGLPVEIAELLRGDTEQDLAKHADTLIKAGVKSNGQTSFDGGTRGGGGGQKQDMDSLLRSAAGRG